MIDVLEKEDITTARKEGRKAKVVGYDIDPLIFLIRIDASGQCLLKIKISFRIKNIFPFVFRSM